VLSVKRGTGPKASKDATQKEAGRLVLLKLTEKKRPRQEVRLLRGTPLSRRSRRLKDQSPARGHTGKSLHSLRSGKEPLMTITGCLEAGGGWREKDVFCAMTYGS